MTPYRAIFRRLPGAGLKSGASRRGCGLLARRLDPVRQLTDLLAGVGELPVGRVELRLQRGCRAAVP